MAVPRFKVGDHVKYNGDIYKIYDIKWYGLNFMYDVICVQNNFPDEFPATSLGMGAENRMTLVDFYPPEKEKWLDEVCKFLKDNIDLEHDYPKDADELIKDLKQYMHNNK